MPTSGRLPLALLGVTLLAFGPRLAARQEQGPLPPGVRDLPIGLSPEEESLMHLIGVEALTTAPPLGPVRAAAEWEENIGVFCLWPNADLFNRLQEGNDVYIISTDPGWWLSWLSSNGIPSTNIHFLQEPTDTFWVRDYGPWFIWDGSDEFGLVDNIYNRPRPLDDVIPLAISQTYGVPYYGMDVIHTGGNYYTDGYGTGLSTTLVYQENPTKSEAQIRQIFVDYLGIDRYLNPHIPYDIQHIDTFGKLLAPDTLLWGAFPENTTPWIYTEASLKWLRTLQSPYGWPYKFHVMPLFPYGGSWTGYINSLQSQRRIFVAKYGTANDAAAQAIYEAAAPGYEVVMVNSGGTNWGDSVHCRSRNFIKGDTIRIYPQPAWERCDTALPSYEVRAEVIPHPSTALAANPVIYWTTTGGAPFSASVMAPAGSPHQYVGTIPGQPAGTTLGYYIHAADLAGGTKDCPLVAPQGLFTIRVEDDLLAPLLEHDVVHGLTPGEWPVTLACTAVDEGGLPVVTVEYRINGIAQAPVTMTREEGTFRYTGQLAGSVSLGDVIAYRITAADAASPPNLSASPTSGWNQFPITAANDVLVIELDTTPDTGATLVHACDDLGLNVQYTQAWPASLAGYDTLMVCLGMNPTKQALTSAQANALVAFMNGGGSVYLEGGDCWAQDSTASIYRSWFGLTSASSGADLPSSLVGVPGDVTQGMNFGYYGERKSSDHLVPAGAARALVTAGGQVKTVAFDTGTYAAVASSFQLSCLLERNSPSHVKYLAGLLLHELGAGIELITHNSSLDPRTVSVDLTGDPGAGYLLFWALGPGWVPVGNKGVLQVDPATLMLALTGAYGPTGHLHFELKLPDDPLIDGLELYLQALQQDLPVGATYLTNRDRFTIEIP